MDDTKIEDMIKEVDIDGDGAVREGVSLDKLRRIPEDDGG